ncbi:MAG: sulfate transporter CysZ [Proteobacteria bacterium]|nr:sulfate transporter CysZ [Pseudomonadota bacterium]
MTDLKTSIRAVLWAFKALLHPKIRHYIYLPLIINGLFFGVLLYFCMDYALAKLSFLSGYNLPKWLNWLNWIMGSIKTFLMLLLFTLLMGMFTILATIGANFLASPFNGLLSEACSNTLGDTLPNRALIVTVRKSISREIRKFFYYLPRVCLLGVILVILYFTPVLNLTIPFICYWFSAWMMAVQYLDYPADNHHVAFAAMIKQLKERKTLSLGFGIIIALLSSIPLVNFVIMPVAVLAATQLWHQQFKKRV